MKKAPISRMRRPRSDSTQPPLGAQRRDLAEVICEAEQRLKTALPAPERARVLADLVNALVTVSRHAEAHVRADELRRLLGIRLPSRPIVWLLTLVVAASLEFRPGRNRLLFGFLRLLLRIPQDVEWDQVRVIQFAYFWHDMHVSQALGLLQLPLVRTEEQLQSTTAWIAHPWAYLGHGWLGLPLMRAAILAMHRTGHISGLVENYPLLAIDYMANRRDRRALYYLEAYCRRYGQNSPFHRLLALVNLQGVHYVRGDFPRLREAVSACFSESLGLRDSRYHIQVYGFHAILLAAEGRAEEAQHALEAAERAVARTSANLDSMNHARLAGIAHALLGQKEEAAHHLAQGLRFCRAHGGSRFYQHEFGTLAALLGWSTQRQLQKLCRTGNSATDVLSACIRYNRHRVAQRDALNTEASLNRLTLRLGRSLDSPLWLDTNSEASPSQLDATLREALGADYVASEVDLEALRRRVIADLRIEHSHLFEGADPDELRLSCPGGGVLIGMRLPQTAEYTEARAIAVRVGGVDLVSEAMVRAAIRIILNQYVFAQSIRVSREKHVSEKRAAAIGRLVRMFAHDIRQPFSLLRLAVEQAQSARTPQELADILQDFVADTQKAITSVDGLLHDVLEIDRKAPPVCAPESIVEILKQSIVDVVRVHASAVIEFEYELGHKASILVERQKITRVITNMLNNAFEAMRGRGRIWFRSQEISRSGQRFIHMTIGNDGPRIAERDVASIFDPLFTKGKAGGTGLGLAIVQKIVNDHGGEVGCLPWTGRGVEFWFTVPAVVSAEVEEGTHDPLPPNSHSVVKSLLGQSANDAARREAEGEHSLLEQFRSRMVMLGRRLRVIVVDDEDIYRQILLQKLGSWPHLREEIDVTAASGDSSFLELSQRDKADLYILDLDLGGVLTGLDLTRMLRRAGARGLVAVHSNRVLPDDFRAAAEAGADACFPKPMSASHLLRILGQAVEGAVLRERPPVSCAPSSAAHS